VIAVAADVALILDGDGVIRDLAIGSDELSQGLESARKWLGKSWVSTVTVESRPKVEALLRDAATRAPPRWRHLNHPSPDGPDVAVLYSAIQVGPENRVVAVGRDLRSISELQQRLVDAQQSLEQDYARLRHMDTRYRVLFEGSTEAILIADAATRRVTETNPAARRLLGDAGRRTAGRTVHDLIDAASQPGIDEMLGTVQVMGRADPARAMLAGSRREVLVTATLFRQDTTSLFLIRLAPTQADAGCRPMSELSSKLIRLVDTAPDGIVLTDADGNVLSANPAFLEMVQVANEEQARGESLSNWLGRSGVDVGVLTTNLRQRSAVRRFATTLRGEHGTISDVEISATASVESGGDRTLGFVVRDVTRRLAVEPRPRRELPRSVEQFTEIIGRVPLKEVVREATDVIERLCIEAALEMTRDNRASAAEMLGLSRQSLYVKLRRYGLGDLNDQDGE
jgi:transcriptional regulator PpsR